MSSLPALQQAQHSLCFFRLDPHYCLFPLTPQPAWLHGFEPGQSLLTLLSSEDGARLEQACQSGQATRIGLSLGGHRWQCHLAPVEHHHWLLSADILPREQQDELGLTEWQLERQWSGQRLAGQLPAVLDILSRQLQPDRIILWRHYEAEELLRPLYSQGLPFTLAPVRAERRYLRTLSQRGGLSFGNCAEQPLLGAFDYLARDGIRHRLDVPLPQGKGPGGLLTLEYIRPHAPMSAADMQFAAAIAGQVATLLEQPFTPSPDTQNSDDILSRLMPLLCRYTGQEFFNQLMWQLAELTGASMVLAGLQHRLAEQIRVIACQQQGRLCPPFNYDLAGTPCAFSRQSNDKVCIYAAAVAEQFPEDLMLAEQGFHAYAGLSLRDDDDKPLGVLVLLFEQPLSDTGWLETLLAELEPRVNTELRQRREQESLMVAAAAFDTREGVFIANERMQIQRANQAFAAMCGQEPESLTGTAVLSWRDKAPGMTEVGIIMRALADRGWWQGEQRLARADGRSLPVNLRISKMQDGLGIVHYVCYAEDISEQQASRLRIEKMAYYDELTGLHNRRFMVEHISHTVALAEHDASRGALLLLDLDHFKHINDSLGYALGDQLLIEVARRLSGFCADQDGFSLARIASDEFVVLCPRLGHGYSDTKTRAEQLANALRELLAPPFELDGLRLHLSAGIGITLFPAAATGLEEYLRQADTATHMAKRIAPGSQVFFSQEMVQEVQERLRLSNALQLALGQQELELHFQPQLRLDNQALVGVEALLRWQPPGQPAVPPGHFIPVAEESALICDLGNWVLQQACERLQHWWQQGHGPERLSVNISARHFHSADFAARLESLLRQYPACRHRLTLEVTESVILENLPESRSRMARLKQLGLGLSIDDFGTGYSSFAYLRELPVDELKLDRAFIQYIDSRPRDKAIIACILELARELELTVVAEGVETEAQRDHLLELGCPACQGFLLARPMPESRMLSWLDGQP